MKSPSNITDDHIHRLKSAFIAPSDAETSVRRQDLQKWHFPDYLVTKFDFTLKETYAQKTRTPKRNMLHAIDKIGSTRTYHI